MANESGTMKYWERGLPAEGGHIIANEAGTIKYWFQGLPAEGITLGAAAALTGTGVPTMTETEVRTGGKTIIITLTGDTWVAAGAAFDAQRQNIINGMDSAQAEATGWDAEVKAKEVVGAVVRTSNTVVTITLTAQAGYNITAQETITVTVPATAVILGVALVATPVFTVTVVAGGVISSKANLLLLGVG